MGYILFSSKDNFSIQASKMWDGIIECSYDNKEWEEWNGETIVHNHIYMRGINNTKITNCSTWIIHGTNVKCQGNIENLLDYKSVINNIHPKMDKECFAWMFSGCQALTEAPQLLATKLSPLCYRGMFCGSAISKIFMIIPSCIENENTYMRMFYNCHFFTETPSFPNVLIAKDAIINQLMFGFCPIQKIDINNKLYDVNILKLL